MTVEETQSTETSYHCASARLVQHWHSVNESLTKEIIADERIPKSNSSNLVTELRNSLEVFAEWQRRLDKEIRS